jgi:signal transduction histidine kinase
LAEGLVAMLCAVGVDVMMPWRFSMFGLYCAIVFIVALHASLRSGLLFAAAAVLLAMLGEIDGISVRGLDGYIWSSLNRFFGIFFSAGFGVYSRKFEEEMRQRLEASERAQELERDLVRVGEREQMRLGQDLHDGVCQTLAALDCAAECLRLDLEADQSPRIEIATEIKRGLSEATLEVRNLARGIYPVWREGETLAMALRSLVARLNALCRGSVEFRNNGDILPQDAETAMHLYRITQEALQNALRHANATRIFVSLDATERGFTLTVGDNGCGSGIRVRPDGIGWRTMKYRAKRIGAKISVSSPPTGGTIISCSVPLASLNGDIVRHEAAY